MSVRDPQTAWAIVEQANRPHAGIMIDSWHMHRTGASVADLEGIPGERILGIQISDALPEPLDDVIYETLHHRLLPGEGAIELQPLVDHLREVESPAPRTAEIFSDALVTSGSPHEIGQRVGDSLRSLLV